MYSVSQKVHHIINGVWDFIHAFHKTKLRVIMVYSLIKWFFYDLMYA